MNYTSPNKFTFISPLDTHKQAYIATSNLLCRVVSWNHIFRSERCKWWNSIFACNPMICFTVLKKNIILKTFIISEIRTIYMNNIIMDILLWKNPCNILSTCTNNWDEILPKTHCLSIWSILTHSVTLENKMKTRWPFYMKKKKTYYCSVTVLQ